jgi:hypothetical protein
MTLLCQIEWKAESDRWLLVTLTWPRTIEGSPVRWKYLLKRFRRSWELRFRPGGRLVTSFFGNSHESAGAPVSPSVFKTVDGA